MNFIKALRKGPPFKRAKDTAFYTRFEIKLFGDNAMRNVGPEDLDADDWENKEPEVIVKGSKIDAVIDIVAVSLKLDDKTTAALKVEVKKGIGV